MKWKAVARVFTALSVGVLVCPEACAQDEDYSFDVSGYEKKAFELRGYAEGQIEHLKFNRSGALYQLSFFEDYPKRRTSDQRYTGTLELEGRYNRDILTASFRTHSEIVENWFGTQHDNRFYEALLSIQPSPSLALGLGKKAYRWGTGIAWNPVAFVERAKDAGDPDVSREGFWVISADWIRTFDGPLQTVAFTPLLLPTNQGLNSGFGEQGHLNPAAKLYLLYRDIDIDFMYLGEGSRSRRYGMDFSASLAANFEIHGEFAYLTDVRQRRATPDVSRTSDEIAYLFGLRYRTQEDVFFVVEYYYNGAGTTQAQQRTFFRAVHAAWDALPDASGFSNLPTSEDALERGPFTRPNPMQHYMNLGVAWDEPHDILYFTPSVQALVNLDDHSLSLTPQLLYNGIDDLEFRFRTVIPFGDDLDEYGEKQNHYRAELRVRWYF